MDEHHLICFSIHQRIKLTWTRNYHIFYEPGDSVSEFMKGVLTLQRVSVESFLNAIIEMFVFNTKHKFVNIIHKTTIVFDELSKLFHNEKSFTDSFKVDYLFILFASIGPKSLIYSLKQFSVPVHPHVLSLVSLIKYFNN